MAKANGRELVTPDLAMLNDLLQATAETEEYLRNCAGCAIDVAKELKDNAEQRDFLAGLKAHFHPTAK